MNGQLKSFHSQLESLEYHRDHLQALHLYNKSNRSPKETKFMEATLNLHKSNKLLGTIKKPVKQAEVVRDGHNLVIKRAETMLGEAQQNYKLASNTALAKFKINKNSVHRFNYPDLSDD